MLFSPVPADPAVCPCLCVSPSCPLWHSPAGRAVTCLSLPRLHCPALGLQARPPSVCQQTAAGTGRGRRDRGREGGAVPARCPPCPWTPFPQHCLGLVLPSPVCCCLAPGSHRAFVPCPSPRCGAREGLSVCPRPSPHHGVCQSPVPSPSTEPLAQSVPLSPSSRDPGSSPRPPAPWTWPMAVAGPRCTWRVSGDSASPVLLVSPWGQRSASVPVRSCQRLHLLLRDPL